MNFNAKNIFLLGIFFTVGGLIGCTTQEVISYDELEKSEIKDGKLVDLRDGNEYGVALIDGLYWMTENLRYADSTSMTNLKGNSWCHEDDKDCSKFGRLYSWTAAVDHDQEYLSKSIGAQYGKTIFRGVCPAGWFVPGKNEWQSLISYVGAHNGAEGTGTSIKSLDTWNKSENVKAPTNRFGFNAKASGRRNNDGETFLSTGRIAFFWSSAEYDNGTASGFQLGLEVNDLQPGDYYKDHGLSVRCVAKFSDVKVSGALDSSYLDKIPHEYGELKYEGETYRTVKIAGLEWMAENLNFEAEGSHCYSDDKDNCKEYGRLYSFETAKTVCPDGWRLPTAEDFSSLNVFAETSSALRATTGWTEKASKGLDFWGFGAKPAGGRDGGGDYFDMKSSAYFWVAGESADGFASGLLINYYDQVPSLVKYSTSNEFSVRCVKDK